MHLEKFIIWVHCGHQHVSSDRNTNRNGLEVEVLLESCQLTSKLAVVKCEAHTSRTDQIAIGSHKADEMAEKLLPW
jgi:hypothetical protein